MQTPSGSQSPAHITPPGGEFLGHPKGLFLLFLVEMWERFSYYGMRGLLVLYMTAAVAVHQLTPGTYSNTLQVEQTLIQTEAEIAAKGPAPEAKRQTVTLTAAVGQPAATPGAVGGEAGPLKIVRMVQTQKTDPKNPSEKLWEPAAEGATGLSPAVFDVKADTAYVGAAVRYRITNPTDRDVKLTVRVQRPMNKEAADKAAADAVVKAKAEDATVTAEKLKEIETEAREKGDPNYKIYFKVNDSTGVVSTTIQADAKREKAGNPPYDLEIDVNRVDSGRSWIKGDASTLYGWYTGMAYLLPILGGLIADKLLGTHRSMVVGGLLIALGHVVLGVSGIGTMALSDTGMTVFVFGLALITIGTGHFKPSVSVMVGQLYPLGDPRRESAFSIFYMGINLGSFLCNLACGTLAVAYGWHYGFGAAAIGMILGLTIYLVARPALLGVIGEPSGNHGSKAALFLPVGIVAAALVALAYQAGILRVFDDVVSQPAVFGLIAAAAVAYAFWFIFKHEPGDRGPVATIFIYMLFNALFWLAFEQAGSTLNTFTEEQTIRDNPLGGGEVPATFFQSINPLLIIIFAPIAGVFWASLARKKKFIAQPFKIGMGLIFVGLGYVVMVMAAMKLNLGIPKVSMIYITGCYFLHTVGEIILSPTGLSYVAKTAPQKSMSSLMGIWFISSFIAGLAAGKVGELVEPIIDGKIKLPWNSLLGGSADFYALFVLTSCGAGVLIMVIGSLLTKLQRNPGD